MFCSASLLSLVTEKPERWRGHVLVLFRQSVTAVTQMCWVLRYRGQLENLTETCLVLSFVRRKTLTVNGPKTTLLKSNFPSSRRSWHIRYIVWRAKRSVKLNGAWKTWVPDAAKREWVEFLEVEAVTSPAAARQCWCSSRWPVDRSRRWTGCTKCCPHTRRSSRPSAGGPEHGDAETDRHCPITVSHSDILEHMELKPLCAASVTETDLKLVNNTS